ncbi:DUF4426 domain-containing protein [Pseudomonas sp. UBA1879]|uniref:DUF4426 domain-containing protein n=1 Tax=Pseudomonas sp. UBA1879 TaxID=1947305 RepID=UPI0025D17E48|nr:DUF4426 domain-containing protein [Pseudomonas sp. UBA1879]
MARLIAWLGMLLTLATPAMAVNSASPNRLEQFGDLTIHYNAFGSGLLQPAVAQKAGLIRSKGQGVINITAIKDGKTVATRVDGSVADLTGREDALRFKPISENGSVSYMAQFDVQPDSEATYVFTINVKASDGSIHTLRFNQQIFSDE